MKLIKSKKKYKLIDQTVNDIYLKLDINKRSIIISNQHLIDTIYLNQIMSKINKIALKLLPYLDDEDPEERELGLRIALILLGKCEELWVFDRVSKGMAEEIAKAKRRNMPIRYFDFRCEEVSKWMN